MTQEHTQIHLLLDNNRCVPKSLYRDVELRVMEVIPALAITQNYTAQQLCGDEFWLSLSMGDRRLAGMCIRQMAKTKSCPLKLEGCEHKTPHKYRLK